MLRMQSYVQTSSKCGFVAKKNGTPKLNDSKSETLISISIKLATNHHPRYATRLDRLIPYKNCWLDPHWPYEISYYHHKMVCVIIYHKVPVDANLSQKRFKTFPISKVVPPISPSYSHSKPIIFNLCPHYIIIYSHYINIYIHIIIIQHLWIKYQIYPLTPIVYNSCEM